MVTSENMDHSKGTTSLGYLGEAPLPNMPTPINPLPCESCKLPEPASCHEKFLISWISCGWSQCWKLRALATSNLEETNRHDVWWLILRASHCVTGKLTRDWLGRKVIWGGEEQTQADHYREYKLSVGPIQQQLINFGFSLYTDLYFRLEEICTPRNIALSDSTHKTKVHY